MKKLDELTEFVNQIVTPPYKYPGDSYNPTDKERYTLTSIGGLDNTRVSLEIWYEDYNLTDVGIDKRNVYNIEIKMREVDVNETNGSK